MTPSPSVHHGHHIIKTMKSPSGFKARAFRGQVAVGGVFEGETFDMAVEAVKIFLNERARDLRSKRGPSGFPCAQEVQEALSQVRISKAQETMLAAHLAAPDHVLTASELATAAGYKKYSSANLHYGTLARRLAEELGWTPTQTTNDVTTWTFTLADAADPTAYDSGAAIDGEWQWRLRPEVVEALREEKPASFIV